MKKNNISNVTICLTNYSIGSIHFFFNLLDNQFDLSTYKNTFRNSQEIRRSLPKLRNQFLLIIKINSKNYKSIRDRPRSSFNFYPLLISSKIIQKTPMHNYESHRESKILFENNQNSKRWHSLKGSKFTPHRYTISPRPFTSFPSLVRATRPCHEHGRNNNNIPISIRAKKSKRKGENGWSRMILAPLDSTREIEKTWKRMMR